MIYIYISIYIYIYISNSNLLPYEIPHASQEILKASKEQ